MIWLGIILFFGVHLVPSFDGLRDRLIALLGTRRYKGLFALLSFSGIALMAVGYGQMEYQQLWAAPDGATNLALGVMYVVVILWVSSGKKGHIRKTVRHPMLIGMLLWSLVHLLNNGDRASLYLFGAFAIYSVYAIFSANRRGKVPQYTSPELKSDIIAIAIGSAIYGIFLLWAHQFLFGVTPPF